MTNAVVENDAWYHLPVDVTPDREERLYEWVASYANEVRSHWAANGEDVTSDKAVQAFQLVCYSMLVPERPTWMPLGKALGFKIEMTLMPEAIASEDPNSDAAVNYRDALRTLNTATEAEWDWALGNHLGVAIDVAHQRRLAASPLPDAGLDLAGRTSLYRHFDASGVLLYVGIASDPRRRREQHQRSSKWSALADEMTVEWFPTREEAHDAEKVAIANELPIFNTTHAARGAKDRAIDYVLGRLA